MNKDSHTHRPHRKRQPYISGRPKLGVANFVGWAALVVAGNLGLALVNDVHLLGGPDLVFSHDLSTLLGVIRFAIFFPVPLATGIIIARLPKSRRTLIGWIGVTTVALTLHVPLIFPDHTGPGVLVLIGIAHGVAGLLLARGQRFADICRVYDVDAMADRVREQEKEQRRR